MFHIDTLVRHQHALSLFLLIVTISRNTIIFPIFLIRKLKLSCSSKCTHREIGSPSEPWKSNSTGRGAGGNLSSPCQLFSHSLDLQCLSLNLMSWIKYSSFKSCSLGHTQTSQDNLFLLYPIVCWSCFRLNNYNINSNMGDSALSKLTSWGQGPHLVHCYIPRD